MSNGYEIIILSNDPIRTFGNEDPISPAMVVCCDFVCTDSNCCFDTECYPNNGGCGSRSINR